ncbi:EAL domain-containing protein [Acuticoccus sp. MNP-M23]|uniref:EAL domain-containing protein n=1 Tax=Acuticoccus sp. MNP-M23 TaxID=3072793 RepID=UPI0028151288|nr:EAL domain-containing protein [Acuticoccus sp. MNP-M23]WMS43406.1 EAL domain-containing protein [Acuticoccus sp. MNP-M23]
MANPMQKSDFGKTADILQFVTAGPDEHRSCMVNRALDVMRHHLNMDVAYINEVRDDHTIARYVNAEPGAPAPTIGEPRPARDGYCRAMLDGNLPGLIPNTADVPFAQSLDVTHAFPVAAYVAAPLHLQDGSLYGTFCCVSRHPNETLNDRDHAMLKAFCDLASYQITQDLNDGLAVRNARARVSAVLAAPEKLTVALQPIWGIQHARPFAVEVLSRFEDGPYRTPDLWFADAELAGMRAELELLALRRGLETLYIVPEAVSVSINVSPDTAMLPGFADALEGRPLHRIILELTEHSPVSDYPALRDALAPLRKQGVALAVDDAGGGYASLSHILQLKPDIIKADISLTRNIHRDKAAQSLMSALAGFAQATGSKMVAEGVENAKELSQLQRLGVGFAQGYHLGRPVNPANLPDTLGRGAAAIYPPPDNVAGVRLEPEIGAFYEPRTKSAAPRSMNDETMRAPANAA